MASSNVISEIDERILFFSNVNSLNSVLSQNIARYYESQKNIILYVINNLQNIDINKLISLKQNACNVMNAILENAENQNSSTYVEVCDMMKETYDSIEMLCHAFGAQLF